VYRDVYRESSVLKGFLKTAAGATSNFRTARWSQWVDATLSSNHLALKAKAKNARSVRSTGTLPLLARFSPSAVNQIGSSGQALSNQCVGWCCIDRLSWHRQPDGIGQFRVPCESIDTYCNPIELLLYMGIQ